MTIEVNSEVIINTGLHQFQRGLIVDIDTTTEIPFARIALRGSKGQLLQRKSAFVPLKYCGEYDERAAKAIRDAMKAARKQRREELKVRQTAQIEIDAEPLSWD